MSQLGEKRAKELGLEVINGHRTRADYPGFTRYYLADDIYKLLGEGQAYTFPEKNPTHSALLIGIRQIRPQTLEDLVREFVNTREYSHLSGVTGAVDAFCTKAREILKGGK